MKVVRESSGCCQDSLRKWKGAWREYGLLPGGFPHTELRWLDGLLAAARIPPDRGKERWLDMVLAAARISLDCGNVVERSLVAAKILFD
jgi:hypothetical protein